MTERAASLLTDADVKVSRSAGMHGQAAVLTSGDPVKFVLRDGVIVWLTSPDLPSWMPDAVHDLEQLSILGHNWDSYRARPILPDNIVTALEVLLTLVKKDTPRPYVVPTVIGGVQLEWHTLRADLEIEVVAPLRLHVLWEPEEGSSCEIEVVSDFVHLREWVAQIS
ncbi:MAG TPA: hypothetical protein VJA16_20310 [Thermoanaerobaculia bacterium]